MEKRGEVALDLERPGLGKEKKRGESGEAMVVMLRVLALGTKGFLEGRILASMIEYYCFVRESVVNERELINNKRRRTVPRNA